MAHRQSALSRRGTMGGQQSSMARYVEKRKEVEAVMALERGSEDFASRFEALGGDFDVVAEAAKVHGSVLAHWPHMLNLVSLFLNRTETGGPNSEEILPTNNEEPLVRERLVRVPIDALQNDHPITK